MKFNGKQTGSHKANNAQRLTEVNILIHISSNRCLLLQLFSGSGAFCCSRHWQWGDGLSCCGQGDLQLWQGDHQPDCGWLNQSKNKPTLEINLLAFRRGYMDWKLIDDVIHIKCWNIILSVQLVSFQPVFCFSTRWPNYANRAKKTNYSKYTLCIQCAY